MESNLIMVSEYYTTEGDKVILNRKIGDGNWEMIVTPYTQVPYVEIKWMSKEEIETQTPTPKLSREDFMDNLEPLLKPLYVSGSFDVFNLKINIERQLDQLLHLQALKYIEQVEELRLDQKFTADIQDFADGHDQAIKDVLEILKKESK